MRRGRVCALDLCGTTLFVGDYSSTLKVFDLAEMLGARGGGPVPEATRVPNAVSTDVHLVY